MLRNAAMEDGRRQREAETNTGERSEQMRKCEKLASTTRGGMQTMGTLRVQNAHPL